MADGDKKAASPQPTILHFANNGGNNPEMRQMQITIFDIKAFTDPGPALQARLKQAESAYTGSGGGASGAAAAAACFGMAGQYNGSIVASIMLPIPNELSDNYVHTFQSKEGAVSALVNMVPGVHAAQEEVANRAAAHLGLQKVMANPGYFQNYTGTEPRTFTFTFKLIPNSAAEAQKIIDIVLLIKKYSSPKLSHGNAIMTAPNIFAITFKNNTLERMLSIKPCVVTAVEVNYASSGVLEVTYDGMPKFMTMTLHLAEVRALSQEDW